MGDNMPDFSSMTPEEQMRWLESLAKRQGATDEGFTTSADMEVDELNPDEVDMSHVGPGYTPSETFSFSKHADDPPPQTPPPAETSTAPPEPEPVAEQPPVAPEPSTPAPGGEMDMESLSSSDPLAFLEALAARQGADPNTLTSQSKMDVPELDESTVDQSNFGPGYTPSETFSWSKTADDTPAAATPPPPVEEVPAAPPEPIEPAAEEPPVPAEPPAAAPTGELDLEALANSDPAAFMRALAARQGADPATLGEGDDAFEVPELDESTVDQSNFGPGYTPSETFSWSKTADDTPAASTPPPPLPAEDDLSTRPVDVDEAPVPAEPPQPPPAAEEPSFADEELQAEADPMQWLNSLAGNQEEDIFEDVDDDMFTLQEVDPESTDFAIDEQQDTRGIEAILDAGVSGPPDAPFADPPDAVLPPEPLDEMPSDQPPAAPYTDADIAHDDAMSWLEDLAEDQGAEVSDFLSEMTDTEDALPGFDLDYDADADNELLLLDLGLEQDDSAVPDLISGLTDEEIAQMQRDGTITPEQELAWLTQKAEQLSELHAEDDTFDVDDEITDDIVPAEMPDWLQVEMQEAMSAETETVDEENAATFVDDIVLPDAPDDLPSWLMEEEDADVEGLELDDLELEDTSQVEPIAMGVDEPELELSENVLSEYDPSLDHWTEALDQEYEGQPTDVDELYRAAAEQVEQEMAAATTSAPDLTEAESFDALENEMDWLSEAETVIAGEGDSDMPDWLRPSADVESEDISSWLREQQMGGIDETEGIGWMTEPVSDVDSEDLSWLSEGIEDPAAEPEPSAPPTPEPQPASVAAGPAQPAEEMLSPGVDGELPGWYLRKIGVVPVPEPAPAPTRQQQPSPPPPQSMPVPATPSIPPRPLVPAAELDGLIQAVQQNPADHDTRLRLAQGLSDNQRLNEGLQQYETLVNQMAALETVADDLNRIISQQAQHPKARRLLGDVYMRQGRLQEALDTYRGALNQI